MDEMWTISMAFERPAQEPFGGSHIAPFAEPELDRVAMAVDGAVQVHPATANFDIRLINMPRPADGSLAWVKLLQQKRSVVDGPALNGGVIHRHAPLGHHLFQVPQAQAVSEVPPDAQQDHRAIDVTAFENLHLWSMPEAYTELSYGRVCGRSVFAASSAHPRPQTGANTCHVRTGRPPTAACVTAAALRSV